MRTISILTLMLLFSWKAPAQPKNDLEKSNLKGNIKEIVEVIYKVVAGKQKLESKSTTLYNEKGNNIEFRSCLSGGGCSLQQYFYDKEDRLYEEKTYWKNVLESHTTYTYRDDSAFSTMYRYNDWGGDTVTHGYRPSDAKYVNVDGLIEGDG